jgi:serpin B
VARALLRGCGMRITHFAILLGACSSRPDVIAARQLPAAIQADAAAVVAGNNQLAIDLYRTLPAGNAIVSPFSIATALSMLDAGAANQTDSELRAALHVTLPGDQLHAAYAALLKSLDTGRSYGAYTLATADRLFGQQGFAFAPAFVDTTRDDYGAPIERVDFASAPDVARGTINQWVDGETDHAIPELFGPNTIDTWTTLVLANAIVFEGAWANKFDPKQTTTGAFHVAGGGSVNTPLMTGYLPISTNWIGNATVGVLPFQGNDLAFVIVLPDDPDGLPAVEAELTGATLTAAIAAAREPDARSVTVPKLALTQNQTLVPLLESLGIHAVFDPATSDLSGIDGARDLYVSNVVHDAKITVDEHGADAAAASGVQAGPGAAYSPFTADHSFLFAIYDTVTGSILFLGRAADPTQS